MLWMISLYFLFHIGAWDKNWNSRKRDTVEFQGSQRERRNTKVTFLEVPFYHLSHGHDTYLTRLQQKLSDIH